MYPFTFEHPWPLGARRPAPRGVPAWSPAAFPPAPTPVRVWGAWSRTGCVTRSCFLNISEPRATRTGSRSGAPWGTGSQAEPLAGCGGLPPAAGLPAAPRPLACPRRFGPARTLASLARCLPAAPPGGLASRTNPRCTSRPSSSGQPPGCGQCRGGVRIGRLPWATRAAPGSVCLRLLGSLWGNAALSLPIQSWQQFWVFFLLQEQNILPQKDLKMQKINNS